MLSVYVKLKTIYKNILSIKKKLKPNTKFCAVVKANAYGFGDQKISKFIEPIVDSFAVASVSEGVRLRTYGIKKDILIFGVTDDIKTAIENNLIITVNSAEEALFFIKEKLQPRIHIAVNTGMNRYGLNSIYELRSVIELLHNGKVEGLYTHFAYEENNLTKINDAMRKFNKYVFTLKKYFPKAIVHASCSGAINFMPANYDMVRIGKAMYGGTEDTETAMTVTSKIVAIKKVKSGETVGYNGDYKATHPTVIGVVRGGYSNGIQMRFTNANFVTVDKKICPIVGRICMDCFFIDVSTIVNPLGKTVTIISPEVGQTIMDVFKKTGVIACDIMQGFNP